MALRPDYLRLLVQTMFLLEEMIHNFNSRIWIPALTSSIVSAFITFLFFGTKPCLYIPITTKLPVASYPCYDAMLEEK